MDNCRTLRIFDTTLREGDQAAGFAFRRAEKIQIAHALEDAGVDCIEAGFPVASGEDFEICRTIFEETRIQIAVMCRGTLEDIRRSASVFSAPERGLLHISLPVSDLHIRTKLGKSRRELLHLAQEMAHVSADLAGMVEMGAEDATRAELSFLLDYCETVTQAGARIVNIADTVGFAVPSEMASRVEYLVRNVPAFRDGRAILSVHCHNDLGLADANTIGAIQGGCGQIEVTALGIGDRAGNAALEELGFFFHARPEVSQVTTHLVPSALGELSRLVSSITGTSFSPLKPVTGENVRAHAAGMHQQGLLRNPSTYAAGDLSCFNVYPERFVLSRHSGQAGIQAAVRRYAGISVEGSALESLREKVKAKAGEMTSLGITELLALLAEQGLLSASLWRCSAFHYEESQTGKDMEYHCRAELRMSDFVGTYAATSSEADNPEASWSVPLVALVIQAAGTPVQIRTISVTGYQGKCRPGKVRVYLEASANARIYALERTGPCRERLLLDLLLDVANAERALRCSSCLY